MFWIRRLNATSTNWIWCSEERPDFERSSSVASLLTGILWYLHFRSNPLMHLSFFATVHRLMSYTSLIDSCQLHLPVHYASNIEMMLVLWLTASHTWVTRAKQASCLLHWLSVAFPFYTLTKPLKRLYFKYKTVLIPKFRIYFFLHFRFL